MDSHLDSGSGRRSAPLISARRSTGRLTSRQRLVLTLLAAGHSDATVAEALDITVDAAATARRLAFRTTGIRHRGQVQLWLTRAVEEQPTEPPA